MLAFAGVTERCRPGAVRSLLMLDFEDVLFKLANMDLTITPEAEDVILKNLQKGMSVYDTTCEATAVLLRDM